MTFSIVVPIYNVEKYLERCIDSILAQTFQDYELLLVNDGSTDNSAVICKRYLRYGERVKYYEKSNGGLGDARNYGIGKAKGDFLVFVDSDDYIEPDMLNIINETIKSYNSDIVIFNHAIVNMKDELLYVEKLSLPTETIMNLCDNRELLLIDPSACSKVYKRELFVDNQIDYPERVWYEDLRTTAKVLSLADRIVYIDRALYHYFKRPGSIMNNANTVRNLEIIEAVEDLRVYFEEKFKGLYQEEIEFLAVEKVLVDAVGRIMSVAYDKKIVEELSDYVRRTFPNYKDNKYLKHLNRKQNIIYFLMQKKAYRLIRLMFILRHLAD